MLTHRARHRSPHGRSARALPLPADQIPVEPGTVGHLLTGEEESDLPIVSASALMLRAWGQVMQAALVACAQRTNP